ncbi:hypothetical protein OGAPHI_002001 [Ogataea philodendri]|uniref:Uncharacterized protein n=1 Tax=Ogataea philodendri TaxID=1378263 RepID=A0A9P8PBD9_9ASCO|nr:uncharacterized protein OGAPHI_002001 [Ogataea philodendri]KAH3668247.1 hypothetical protein OGAPHI_002001 [Ogataea philodendri]
MPNAAHFTAWSRSASSYTISGDFPPHSRVHTFRFSAASFWMILPTPVLPVKVILSIPLCAAMCEPTLAPSPQTTFTSPGGAPAFTNSSHMNSADNGVFSDVFTTIALPAARHGATFHANVDIGKFHAMMAAHTPYGSVMVYVNLDRSVSMVLPSSALMANEL